MDNLSSLWIVRLNVARTTVPRSRQSSISRWSIKTCTVVVDGSSEGFFFRLGVTCSDRCNIFVAIMTFRL